MPLPKINTPIYELELPSTKKKIRYRPFLVKEEKILIIAMESEDQKQITTAIKTVIGNCILSRGIKVEQLSTFDIEYLFLNVRGKSVGEEVEVLLTCPDDEETQVLETATNMQTESMEHGAGLQTAQKVLKLEPDVIITGNGAGNKALDILKRSNVKMYVGAGDMTLKEAYEAFKSDKLRTQF